MHPELGPGWDLSFKTSPYRLRFELGGEVFGNLEAPIPRFTQAFDRSRAIADAVFAATSDVVAIVGCSPDPSRDFFAPASDGFLALAALGFSRPALAEWRAHFDADDAPYDVPPMIWKAFSLASDSWNRDTLLWSCITYEMPITPNAPTVSYLVDFERGLLLHVYDDRGMDVTATAPKALSPIYRKFDAWLLDYDRVRMAAAFSEA